MMQTWQQWIAMIGAAAVCAAATPAASKEGAKPATSKSTTKTKRYRSSAGTPSVKTSSSPAVKRRVIPKGPPVSQATRREANQGVFQKVANGAELPVEN